MRTPSLTLDALMSRRPAPAPRSPLHTLRHVPRERAPAPWRAGVVGAMVAVHALLLAGLLGSQRLREEVRKQVREVAPIVVSVLAAPPPALPPARTPPPPRAMPTAPALAVPVIAPAPAAEPAPQAIAAAPPAGPVTVAPADAAPAPPAPVATPKTLPAAAVQYLVAPAPAYSRTSARLRESGRVVLRVWIDEAGLPRDVQLASSSGFARLDDAALVAARAARFRPYVENGVATAGWAFIPIEFELPA